MAVKCFSSLLVGRQYGDAGSQRAFLTSAAPVAALRHPHLVKVSRRGSEVTRYKDLACTVAKLSLAEV